MLFKNSSSIKISTFIVLFPPIVLLIYALVSYIIFFNIQDIKNQDILKIQENTIVELTEKSLNKTALAINAIINIESKKDNIFKFVKTISKDDEIDTIILDKKGRLIYATSKINKKLFDKLKNIKSIYKDDMFIAKAINSNKLNWKIIVYCTYHCYKEELDILKNKLESANRAIFVKSLFWLAISWFLMLFISLGLSIVVFNRLKQYEKEIKRSNEKIIFQSRQALLGELLPMIAHQWRQPINKIASVLMRIRFELANPNPNVTTLDRQAQLIEDSVELMSNTIDDFRTFYRPKENAEYVDLSLLVRKAIYFLDELLERKKIRVKTDLDSVKVKLHANEFLQVIINLIKNAADAVGVKGHIYIVLREVEDNMVELRVEDDGVGIPHDKLEKIFEAHESTKQGSMGLGLYMSKLIIENHFGGIIKAYNTSRGAGFLIRLPKDGVKEEK